MADVRADKAGQVLESIINMLGQGENGEILGLFRTWSTMVGNDDIASHSAIEDIRNGTVIVLVDHPAWMQLLQQKEQKILANVKRQFPSLDIKRLLIKVGKPKVFIHNLEQKEKKPEEKTARKQDIKPKTDEAKVTRKVTNQDLQTSLMRLQKTLQDKKK